MGVHHNIDSPPHSRCMDEYLYILCIMTRDLMSAFLDRG